MIFRIVKKISLILTKIFYMRTITRGVSFPVKQTMKVLNTNSVLLSIILKTYLYGHKSPYEALVNFIRENSLKEILMVLVYQVLVPPLLS